MPLGCFGHLARATKELIFVISFFKNVNINSLWWHVAPTLDSRLAGGRAAAGMHWWALGMSVWPASCPSTNAHHAGGPGGQREVPALT